MRTIDHDHVYRVIANCLQATVCDLNDDTSLEQGTEPLHLDEIDVDEIVLELEDEFDINIPDRNYKTIGELIEAMEKA